MSDAQQIAATILPMIIILGIGIGVAVGSKSIRVSPILGYLVLGLAIGRWSPHLLGATGTVRILSQLGVAFLLFDIGLHFSLAAVRRDAKDIFGFGPVQVACATVVLAFLGRVSGQTPVGALLVGGTLALSSTAVVSAIIAERHQRTCPVGTTATSILIFQDVAAIVMLILTTAIPSGGVLPILAGAIAKTAVAIALVVGAQRTIVRPLFGVLSRYAGEEVFTAVALVVAMAAGWAALVSGLSLTLGAFLGGMVFADSPFRALIRSEIAPFRSLLISFFFITVGASIDLAMAADDLGAIIVVALGIMLVKSGTNAVASLVFRWSVPGSVQLGFLLSQGSEFAFVILAVPEVRQIVGSRTSAVLIAAVAATLALTPIVSDFGRKLAGRLRARKQHLHFTELKPHSQAEPVLIIGMGRVGRAVADALARFGIGYDAVERDGDRLRIALADGYHAYFGDADDPRFWRAADMGERRFSVVTAGRLETAGELHALAGALFPSVRNLIVVQDGITAERMGALGVEAVLDRSEPIGSETARVLLRGLGIEDAAIATWSSEKLVGAEAGSMRASPLPDRLATGRLAL